LAKFKAVNDKYGHDVGDNVLKEYTKIISSLLRSSDIFCRIGGEEFVIILPHTNIENAKSIAQKLRITVESSKVIIPITISFGVVEYKKGENLDSIFKRVDNALYKAKKSGRNRVEVG
jgi:diguanylate cyclase (GGDEF)-like protein